jgi:hypothetical protein
MSRQTFASDSCIPGRSPTTILRCVTAIEDVGGHTRWDGEAWPWVGTRSSSGGAPTPGLPCGEGLACQERVRVDGSAPWLHGAGLLCWEGLPWKSNSVTSMGSLVSGSSSSSSSASERS